MSVSQDGSESVDQFLARIASVRENKDQASEERNRRMEEDFLKNRKERQARRLERARSLSPSKTGPSALTSASQNSTTATTKATALNPPVDFSPQTPALSRSNAVSARTSPKLEAKRVDAEISPETYKSSSHPNSAANLSRSGTLSWQQRPARDGVISRPRPLSSAGMIRPVSDRDDAKGDQPEPTRQEITASLRMKDPAWFRQTQDRGKGSAAFRKNQVEDPITVEHSVGSGELPGLSREGTRSASRTPARDTEPSTTIQERQLSPPLDRRSRREPSPIPVTLLETPKLKPSPQQSPHVQQQQESVSNTLTRASSILAVRPPSPTKGLGGFVESAMMKRSDSINKRWSVQANTGLKRGDSVAGARPLSGIRSAHAASMSRGLNRDDSPSPMPNSRPESRDGGPTMLSRSATPERRANAVEPSGSTEPAESGPKSPGVTVKERPQTPTDDRLSRSPSKNTDNKRWSPTKSSWLESALLSQPEQTKLQPAKEDVPAWKATLQRNKASKDFSPERTKLIADDARPTTNKQAEPPNRAPIVNKKPNSRKLEDKPVAEITQAPSERPNEDEKFTTVTSPSEDAKPEILPQSPSREVTAGIDKLSTNEDQVNTSTPAMSNKVDKKPPPVLKPKPQTPPTTDFRSTLRSRAPAAAEDKGSEPEFRSIFGKLKPAQAQNYVAPDVLKTNILSGKAALNTTNGPQKQQRVDEFKERILRKKEAMKTNAVQKKDSPGPEAQNSKPESPVPEALARRKTLGKASAPVVKLQSSMAASNNGAQLQSKPVVTAKPKPQVAQPSVSPAEERSEQKHVAKPETREKDLTPPPSSVKSFAKPWPFQQSKDSTPTLTDVQKKPFDRQAEVSANTSLTKQSPIAEPRNELPPASKLASRLNPNLATLLSRGGSPRPIPSDPPSPERQNSDVTRQFEKVVASEEPAGELTHMTKGRARGPKRRAPKVQAQQSQMSVQTKPVRVPTEESPSVESEAVSPGKSFSSLRGTFAAQPATQATPVVHKTIATNVADVKLEPQARTPVGIATAKPKPMVATKSSEVRKVSSVLPSPPAEIPASKASNNGGFEIATDADTSSTNDSHPPPRELPKIPKPVATTFPLTPSKSRINTPKASQSPVDPPIKPQSPKPITGLGVSTKPSFSKSGPSNSQVTPEPDRPTKLTASIKPQKLNTGRGEIQTVISAYFPDLPEKQHRAEFDAHDLLLRAKESNDKIKTISHTIQEVNGDGKKSTMPPQQDHILYEESMYIVTHSFQTGSSTKSSEVYLWCGDDVADAAVEDAQLFCRRDARDHNAKLEVIRQGKEHARFFQALGGILIVRRSKSSSLYMLRGRRHLGHISFDEVDITKSNLCSGFSYLISAKFGKLYLWKGDGSAADEVGCARLIGMDLGLTGEIEEIEEGKEPASFWESFSPQEPKRNHQWSADWQQRAGHNCYPMTLYKVDVDRPKSRTGSLWGLRAASPPKQSNKIAIEMVDLMCDRDLEPTTVYVLDAYRSIYVLFDPQAIGKPAEVIAALDLSQELAMLAPSVQDRSSIPSCFVVFGEPPPDVKVCFRKWSERKTPKSDKPSACLRMEDVMEALNL